MGIWTIKREKDFMSDDLLKRQEEYLLANLLDYFRTPEHEQKWLEAAKITQNFFKRLAIQSAQLDKRVYFFSLQLKGNIDVSSLRFFAQECVKSAANYMQVKGQSPKEPTANLQKRAQKAIKRSMSEGHSEHGAASRAAYSLINEQKAYELEKAREKQIENHPLGYALTLFNSSKKPLAREDIRNHLLKLKNKSEKIGTGQGVLFNLLKKAQSFSPHRLYQLLGDDLFFLCRPVGFADKNGLVIEVEVPSSAHLHALSFRKAEILKALKADAAFKQAQNIRMKVKAGYKGSI